MLLNPSLTVKAESKLPKRAWLVVLLLSFVGCLNYLDRMMITTMHESIVKEMPMTDGQFGLLTSVFLWVYGILSPFTGFLADRFSRSRVIILSLFVWSATTFLTAYSTSFEQLLATRVLMGISESCYIPAAYALIVDYHKGPTRSFASGLHIAGIMSGQSFGFVGGWLAEEHKWNTSFIVFGILGVVYSLVLAFILRDPPKSGNLVAFESDGKVSFLSGIKDLFKRRAYILVFIIWGLLGVSGWIISGWLPVFYQKQFNLSQTLAGLYATGYIYPASIVGVILGGLWTDYWRRKYKYAQISVPIIGLLISVPCVIFASNSGSLMVAITLFMIYGLVRMFTDANIMPILCLAADHRYRATGFGVMNLLACVVGGVGIYAGGLLQDRNINLSEIFAYGSLLMLVCVVCLYLIKVNISKKPFPED
ncbi:MAG: MFS transporter [Chitinophagaceae bacterium]|nr:MFS transporter [Chitinophagaceae bacterium]